MTGPKSEGDTPYATPYINPPTHMPCMYFVEYSFVAHPFPGGSWIDSFTHVVARQAYGLLCVGWVADFPQEHCLKPGPTPCTQQNPEGERVRRQTRRGEKAARPLLLPFPHPTPSHTTCNVFRRKPRGCDPCADAIWHPLRLRLRHTRPAAHSSTRLHGQHHSSGRRAGPATPRCGARGLCLIVLRPLSRFSRCWGTAPAGRCTAGHITEQTAPSSCVRSP